MVVREGGGVVLDGSSGRMSYYIAYIPCKNMCEIPRRKIRKILDESKNPAKTYSLHSGSHSHTYKLQLKEAGKLFDKKRKKNIAFLGKTSYKS